MRSLRVRRVEVSRTFTNGMRVLVGTLAQNADGVFFQYAEDYLASYADLSPFGLIFNNQVQKGPRTPHEGLHGAFADSLPDGWGRSIVNRYLRQKGINPSEITVLDRLALVNEQSSGSLSYESDLQLDIDLPMYSEVFRLGEQAQALFSGKQVESGLEQLMHSGSAAGSRPKAQLYLAEDNDNTCAFEPGPCLLPYLVKFTHSEFPLGHDEGVCEAAFMQIATAAGIQVAPWRLLSTGSGETVPNFLAMQRFDRIPRTDYAQRNQPEGKVHVHTVDGLLDADFRTPCFDYEDLIKLGSKLCQSPAVGQEMFRRAIFNLFAVNQDDHTKNWAFTQADDGSWQPAPFYDVTFAPTPSGEHITAFSGYGANPPAKTIERLAAIANYSSWKAAQCVIEEVIAAIQSFSDVATDLGIAKTTRSLIQKRLEETRQANAHLLS